MFTWFPRNQLFNVIFWLNVKIAEIDFAIDDGEGSVGRFVQPKAAAERLKTNQRSEAPKATSPGTASSPVRQHDQPDADECQDKAPEEEGGVDTSISDVSHSSSERSIGHEGDSSSSSSSGDSGERGAVSRGTFLDQAFDGSSTTEQGIHPSWVIDAPQRLGRPADVARRVKEALKRRRAA